MSDMVIVALVFLLLVGGLYFGTLFITWLFGRRNLPKSPESIFLRIAKFNPDYCALYDTCSIEKDMLEWYFAFSARKTLFRGKKFELDEEMLGIPIEFICRLSRNREQEDHLPPIAGIAAASLSLKRGLLKHPLFVDRADKTMLPVHLDGADKEIWQYFANLYLDHFARRTNRQGLDESILNLSELHSLVILCSNVGLNPSDLFTTDPEGSDLIRYIHTCNRIYKGRVGVFAINNEDRDPCTCGTFFAIDTASLLNQYDFASGANDSNSRLRFDQKGVGYFLEDAYNRKAGGFGAYVQGLPTLIHTELAVRLYKFDGTNLTEDKVEEMLRFMRKCKVENGGFGSYPKRQANIHATKCVLNILNILYKGIDSREILTPVVNGSAEAAWEECVEFTKDVLTRQPTPI